MTNSTDEYRTFGPPGSGKTTWIAKRINKSVSRFGEDLVSVVSLTNSAVREASGRDLPLAPENVTTLHARCKRALGSPAPAESAVKEFIKAYPSWSDEDCLPPFLQWRTTEEEEGTSERTLAGNGDTFYERAQIYRQRMVPMAEWDPPTRDFHLKWSEWCRESERPDYAGWLELALDVHPLPAQQVVYVDEAQDHTPLQLEVIRQWNTKIRVLVGDDDQNLYEWSGAIPQEFFNPQLPDGREKVLTQSYRIPRAVHQQAYAWVHQISDRREKEYLPRDEEGEVRMDAYSYVEAESSGRLPPGLLQEDGTYMIIASCGYMLKGIITALREAGIPFHNTYRKTNKMWNPLDTAGNKIRAFLSKNRLTGDVAHTWGSVLGAKSGAYIQGRREGFLRACKDAEDNEIEMEDLIDAFNPTILERIMAKDATIFKSFRRAGEPGSWDYTLRVLERGSIEDTRPRVTIGTIHSVKGGEADHVYVFPDMSPAGMDNSSTDSIVRMFYVAMTRAKKTLHLCRPSGGLCVYW